MKNIAVFFGGRSAEHDISIVTALSSVIKPLELTGKYSVVPVYISKTGAWYSGNELKDIALYSSGKIDNFLQKSKPVTLQLDGGLSFVSGGFSKKVTKIDIAFPAMHGTYGEDGSLMGLLEMAGIPYVGCNLAASVLAMDKDLSKKIAAAHSIDIAKSITVINGYEEHSDEIIKNIEAALDYPLFVKPAHLGSSIGISRAKNRTELQNGIEVALHYDNKVVVEEEIQNLIEVTLPIRGNNILTPALLEKPLTKPEDFFDFETKYINGGGKKKSGGTKGAQGYSQLPAELPGNLYNEAELTALRTYRALGCSGTARIDMLIDEKAEKVYFNEVNPLPGDLYAHNWRASGVAPVELVQSLVDLAIDYHEQKQAITTAFTTNYLQQF